MDETLPLRELIDLDELQEIQDGFARTIGAPSIIFSEEGDALTHFSNPTGFCSLIQSTAKGRECCFQSFTEMARKALDSGKPELMHCFAHGVHFVAPIVIDGKRKATMLAGQFIPEKFSPEQLSEIREIGGEIGVDRDQLVAEAEKMRVIGEDAIRNYARSLSNTVRVIAKLGAQAIELNRANSALTEAHDELELKVYERTVALVEANEELKREIDERKRVASALMDGEEKYRTLAENMYDIVYSADRNGILTYLSPQVEEYGIPPEDLIERSLLDAVHPDDREKLAKDFERTIGKGTEFISTFRILDSDGGVHWFEDFGRIQRGANGEILGVTGVLRDITERKNAEESLIHRDRILEAVSFAARELLAPADMNERIKCVLERLGQAVDASRVYLFENSICDDGETAMNQRCEWSAQEIVPQIDNSLLQELPYRTGGFARWEGALPTGKIIKGYVNEFPDGEQEVLVPQGIQSILIVPIFVGRAWWGFIGFDDCISERDWTPAEMDALRAAAGTLGAAIQHRRADDALRESEEKYRELVENANSIILRMGVDGRVTFINKFAQKFFGYTSDEILDKNVVGTIVPETDSAGRDLAAMIADLGRNPERYATNENENMRRNGEQVLVAWTNKGVRDDQGRVTEILCIGNDVTEKKRAEDALRRLEKDRDVIFQALGNGAIVLDTDLNILDSNRVVAGATRRSKEELFGAKCYKFVHGTEEPPDNCPAMQIINSGDYRPVEREVDALGGTFMVSCTPVLDDSGDLVKIVHAMTDITKRKSLEDALAQSEEECRTLIENIQDGVFVIHGREIVFVNEAFAEMAGATIEEIIGRPFTDFVAPDDLEMVVDYNRRRLAGEDLPQEYVFNGLHADGVTRVRVNMSVGIIKYRGRIAVLGTVKGVNGQNACSP